MAVRRTLALVLWAVVLQPNAVFAIEAKCSACEAIASDLEATLKEEMTKVKKPLDFRGRLDSKGNRLGKVVNYHKSEQFITDLFDDFCENVDDYVYIEGAWHRYKGGKDFKRPEWLKTKVPIGSTMKALKKEIQGYCARIIEEHEEDLTELIQSDDFEASIEGEGSMRTVLCRTLTDDCKGEDRRRKKQSKGGGGSSTGVPPTSKVDL